jgi:hypothetical protein
VATLPGGTFIVAWTENSMTAGQFVVKAMWLGETGQPVINPVSMSAAAYVASTTVISEKSPPALAALGVQGEHAIVWKNGSSLRGRFYNPAGVPRTTNDVSLGNFQTDEIGEPQAAALAPDIVVLFGRRTLGGDADEGQLILRRVTNTGARTGVDAILARQLDPRPMGLATRADGAIAAAWEACMADTDGAACGIRFQIFRPTLAAVGEAIFANTTIENTQIEPSVAALTDGAFVAAWSDGSAVAPDTDGFSIRARILYPPYDDATGLGGRCTSTAACGEGNVCMAGSDGMPRCYRACSPEMPCTLGGSCTTMGDESACLF